MAEGEVGARVAAPSALIKRENFTDSRLRTRICPTCRLLRKTAYLPFASQDGLPAVCFARRPTCRLLRKTAYLPFASQDGLPAVCFARRPTCRLLRKTAYLPFASQDGVHRLRCGAPSMARPLRAPVGFVHAASVFWGARRTVKYAARPDSRSPCRCRASLRSKRQCRASLRASGTSGTSAPSLRESVKFSR